jgi:hypothetical protein
VDWYATGNEIYEELLGSGLFKDCLNIADLRAIQNRGVGFFRRYFSDKFIFAWKSIALSNNGYPAVPYLYKDYGVVRLEWLWCDHLFFSSYPALFHG